MIEPEKMIEAELAVYVESDEFKRRCSETVERQRAGECLAVEEIAAALGIPLWFAQMSLMETARRMDAIMGDRSDVH